MSNKKKTEPAVIPIDMRRRPLCGPAGLWKAVNPNPEGKDDGFRHYYRTPGSFKK